MPISYFCQNSEQTVHSLSTNSFYLNKVPRQLAPIPIIIERNLLQNIGSCKSNHLLIRQEKMQQVCGPPVIITQVLLFNAAPLLLNNNQDIKIKSNHFSIIYISADCRWWNELRKLSAFKFMSWLENITSFRELMTIMMQAQKVTKNDLL